MEHSKDFAKGLSIGIIMDGNGRWAKSRGLPRTAGHKKGAQDFQDIADYCEELSEWVEVPDPNDDDGT